MKNVALEIRHARPAWLVRKVGPARGDDDDRRARGMLAGLDPPGFAVALHRCDRRVECRRKLEPLGVAFEIVDELRPRWIAPVRGGDPKTWQGGMDPRRMQMQAVVMAPPNGADRVSLVENQRRQSEALRRCAAANPAGPAPMTTASGVSKTHLAQSASNQLNSQQVSFASPWDDAASR